MKTKGKTILGAVAALAIFSAVPAFGGELGRFEYLNSCASCHGEDASGKGPIAEFLSVEVPGLTGLSAGNNGQFPMLEVLGVIDGRACGPAIENRPCPRPSRELAGHGRAMPVWGNRYKDEAVFGDGTEIQTGNPETVVLGRMLALAYYLASIQK